MRCGSVERKTLETEIFAELNLMVLVSAKLIQALAFLTIC